MKLCVIGNSHVAMLVQATREAAPEGLDLTFFARQGRGPEGVRLKGTEMFALHKALQQSLARMGMPDRVDLATFDGFVLVAMTASVFSMSGMVSSHAVHGWGNNEDERPLMSRAALEASLRTSIVDNIAHRMLRKIRRVSDKPVLLVPQPFPAEAAIAPGTRFPALREIHDRGIGPQAVAALRNAHVDVFGDMAGVHLLTQPDDTVVQGFLTAEPFTRGAGRLNPEGRQPEDDLLHANAAYGRHVLDQIAGAFEAA